ncbi:SecY family transport protein [Porphyromonas cangingivalis]|nr:SecY family transport protein [Porphyromonas cangingivalis]
MKRTVRNTLLKGGTLVFSSAILVSLSYDSERPLTRLSMWIMMISYYALLTIVDAKMLADEAKEKDRKKYNKSLTIGAVIICVLGGIAGIYSLTIPDTMGGVGVLAGIAIVLSFLRKNLKGEHRLADMNEKNEEAKDTEKTISQA